MNDRRKTKAQLIDELNDVRCQLEQLKSGVELSPENVETNIPLEEEIRKNRDLAGRFIIAAGLAGEIVYEWDTRDDSLKWYGEIDKILDCKKEEIPDTIGAWLKLIHPQDAEALIDAVKHHRASPEVINYEYRVRCKDDSWRYWIDRGRPVFDEHGNISKWIGICTDITDRKMVENDLRENKERFRTLVEASPDAIILTDFEGKIVNVNKQLAKMHGYDDIDDIMDNVIYAVDLVEQKDRERAERNQQIASQGTVLRNIEYSFLKKDGSSFQGEFSTALIRKPDNDPVGFITITRDISERKLFESLTEVQKELAIQLSKTSDLGEALHYCFDAAMRVSGMDSGGIYLLDEASSCLRLSHSVGLSDAFVECTSEFPLDSPNTQIVMKGDPVHVAYNDLKVNLSEVEKQEGLRVLSVIPVKHEGKVIGCLNLASHSLSSISSFARNALETIGAEIGGIIARIKAEELLQESEEKYRVLVENLIDGLGLVDFEENFVFANSAAEGIFWNPEGGLVGCNLQDFVSQKDFHRIQDKTKERARTKKSSIYELEIVNREGDKKQLQVSVSPHLDKSGEMIGAFAVIRDITDYKNLEAQYMQAQKMESIGRLAGGLAHDFNNLLTSIIGNADLALSSLNPQDPLYQDIIEVYNSAERASDLTRQLLAFSRKQVLEPKVINLNTIILRMERMLSRLMREDVLLNTKFHENDCKIKVDPGQMEQVILNLTVNARDAMPGGGRLLIETKTKVVNQEPDEKHLDLIAGSHACLTISDNGTGISEQTQLQMFDPFFTTKEVGKGTGLGLSTVYGIVKQSGGQIYVYSEEGKGTTFKMYFPLVVDQEAAGFLDPSVPNMPQGNESILVIEDDDAVRKMAVRILKHQGYSVQEANSGGEALLIFEREQKQIDLIISDVVMPNMSGPDFIARVRIFRPGIKVLFMSGYTPDFIRQEWGLGEGTPYLQKPFRPVVFAQKVREVLDVSLNAKEKLDIHGS